ncbi:MAG: HlyD family efflux transporter periplasmic adaptor subunit [Acetobacteraceae bacterium]
MRLCAVLLPLSLLLAAAAEPPRAVRVVTVGLTQPDIPLTLSGTVQARTLADLAFRLARRGRWPISPSGLAARWWNGRLRSATMCEPARSSHGSIPPISASRSRRLKRALVAAQADAANTQVDLQRYVALGKASPAYLPSENDRRVAAARMAAARLTQAQRQAELAHDQSQYGSLLADADGVITALPVQVGQVVTAGQTVASLAHTDDTEVVVDMPENRLAAVRAAGDRHYRSLGPA